MSILDFILLLASATTALAQCLANGDLPVVDLGYSIHQAFSLNETTQLYNFSNIRYAAPPTGDLRWRAPVAPAEDRSVVSFGQNGKVCPQGFPLWEVVIADDFINSYLNNKTFNTSSAEVSTLVSTYAKTVVKNVLYRDGRMTEDCLFLDVVVPKKVFDRNHGESPEKKKLAPVLVWFYPGGNTSGDKSGVSPAGLMKRDQQNGRDGFVFVSINYRVGALGFLGGKEIKANGTTNAGLHDQRFALEWVQKHIKEFGGDPDRVTVMGLSAGAGGLLHQITAYGGSKGRSPFQQAILLSPGWQPTPSMEEQEVAYNRFMELAGAESLEDARTKVNQITAMAANAWQVAESPYGMFTYSPIVDGDFVPNLPGTLLGQDRYDHSLKILTSRTTMEGLLFTAPYNKDPNGLRRMLNESHPFMDEQVVQQITEVEYPPVFDGKTPYKDPIARASTVISDYVFTCNTVWANRAFENNTYGYVWDVYPANHWSDSRYVFYPETGSSITSNRIRNETVAYLLQDYITSFVETGRPHSNMGPEFPIYGAEGNVVDVKQDTITVTKDPNDNERCAYWHGTPYNKGRVKLF